MMKQRNFVAKHAQRSGAGRHKPKEKIMSEYYRDSWNDADQCQITEEEYGALESQVIDLKGEIEQFKEDEILVLAEVIKARDELLQDKDTFSVIERLNKLIQLHLSDVREKAMKKAGDL
jgi:hypothetical protein